IKLFEPITINKLTVKNRIVMPAMALFYTNDYTLTDRFKSFYRRRAKGGVGLMLIGPVAVDRVGSNPSMLGLFTDSHRDKMARFVDELHNNSNVKVGTQLMHLGYFASSKVTGTKPIAASVARCPITGETPREMTAEDIDDVKQSFAQSARRAKEAGFDYLEIVMGGGYLISGFLSSATNFRIDKYGGSIKNRMRLGLEVIMAVKETVGKDFPVGIRVAGHDFIKGGNTNKESALFCKEAEQVGVDVVNMTGGWHATQVPQITSDVPPGVFLYLARGIKEKVSVPVFVSNRLGDPLIAERALRSGSADMICWGRPLLADPDLPDKVKKRRLNEIVKCISCNQGCLDSIFKGESVYCAVNPQTGREGNIEINRTAIKKRVFIAGAGPAGMECAWVAAQRGHDVTLFEKSEQIGGQIHLASAVPGKNEFLGVIESLIARVGMVGVRIKLQTKLTPEIVTTKRPDVLVVASGAVPVDMNVPGYNQPHVVKAWDVLMESDFEIGKNVVVVGGNATGCETAHFIAQIGIPNPEVIAFLLFHEAEPYERVSRLLKESGRKITIVEMMERMAYNMGPSTRWPLIKKLKLLGVEFRAMTKLVAITSDSVIVESGSGKESIPADTVIIAAGNRSIADLAKEGKKSGTEVLVIGDAKEPRKISNAIREGFDAALNI
ncbi:MAG: FAD-dependent oxidoreductase, partial [Syntrophaceae bacterium]|nr:FAD-dependent oxidoreductase [Syntrophaceae bacterium]